MPTPVTSTGIPKLDKSLGKASPGYPLGALTELHGLYGCGASAVCIAAATAALDEGGEVVYYDFGGDVLERLKVEDGLTVHVTPQFASPSVLVEQISQASRRGVRLVVIDSIDRLLQDRRQFNVHRLSQNLSGSSTAVLIVRRYPIHPDPSPWLELASFSQLRIRLSDEVENDLTRVRADLVKVRAGKARAAEFYLNEEGLIDRARRSKPKDPEAPSRFDREDII